MADYIPKNDGSFLAFASNYSTKITASPTTYNLVAGDATALAALVTLFSAAYTLATTPATRTKSSVAAKDTARAVLVADLRSLSKRVQAGPSVTPAQKTDLGLPVHSGVLTPVPPPSTLPIVAVMNTASKIITIRLADQTTPSKRARPVGSAGAEVYSFVGLPTDTPPGDLEQWRFEGIATKSDFDINYNAGDVGKSATIVARWFNRKGETGPVSNPITGTIAA